MNTRFKLSFVYAFQNLQRLSPGIFAKSRIALRLFAIAAIAMLLSPAARAGFVGSYSLPDWSLSNDHADGSAVLSVSTLDLTGGSTGSGDPGTTDFLTVAAAGGIVSFSWSYFSFDLPTFDNAGYIVGPSYFMLADTSGAAGTKSFSVTAGQIFGFRVQTVDNLFEPGILSIADFDAPGVAGTASPEPGTATFVILAGAIAGVSLHRKKLKALSRKSGWRAIAMVAVLAGAVGSLPAQVQLHYTGSDITGSLVKRGQVSLLDLSKSLQSPLGALKMSGASTKGAPDWNRNTPPTLLRPTPVNRLFGAQAFSTSNPAMQSLAINPTSTAPLKFGGLSHFDQRNANNGNQFSVEPPNPSIAAGNGYILEGVNNAVQVYTASGSPLLPVVLSTNQVFGVAPAIDRSTFLQGPFPTDMRVFWDSDIRRWFILQRVADNDIFGNPLPQSHIYLAVSQTDAPTGVFNIYTIDTTNPTRQGCPCIPDFPQIGADKYGFYISSNEFDFGVQFHQVSILAISKAGLSAGAATPTVVEFVVPAGPGYEFTIQPATTPPGASYLTANGGVEYFVSSQGFAASDSNVAVWALANTASLATAAPTLTLTETVVPTLTYSSPPVAQQPPSILPYGNSLGFNAPAPLDGGDIRVLSVSYSGGRLYVTLATKVQDSKSHDLAGGAYIVISPAYRLGSLTGSALRQGYLLVEGNHLLRPAIAVDASGKGAIAFTLAGPGFYPSAAYVPFSAFAPAGAVQIAATGATAEDGFTGYDYPFVARWGDYSGATIGDDGKVYMVTEYIPVGPRTDFANWGTFVVGLPPQ